jgi:ribonuclease P/MRP protein subunit RPP1
MDYIIVTETDFQKARKKIREAKVENKIIVFSSNDDELNRKILEKESIDILLLNLSKRKDRMKQRDSGFNQVLAKLAKKKNVSIGINLDELVSSSGKERVEILARIRQNIKLCNKNKVKTKFISKEKRDVYNLKSLGLVLGMPTWMTKSL